MARVTEIRGGALLDALAEVERAEQQVGVCKAYAHLARLAAEGRQAEVLALLDAAEASLLDAHDRACDASEALLELLDPEGRLQGAPVLGPAAEG